MKIQVSGFSGSGKSTFSKRLSEYYNIDLLHIDTIHFGPNWVERDKSVTEKELNDFIKNKDWIVDGNYFNKVKERYEQADQIFLFEFNRIKCLYGVIKRYYKYRGKSRDSIAKGCNERLNFEFINWVLFTGRTRERKQKNKFLKEKYKDKIIVFKNRKQVNQYLRSIGYKI